MSYRKLVLGISVVGLLILAGTALAQKSKKPTAMIRTAPVAPTPAQVKVSDALDPIEFKPAPMDAYETTSGPQVVYPQAGPPVPAYVPHMGMATRVVAVEENGAPPSVLAPPQVHYAPPVIGPYPPAPRQPISSPMVQFPSAVPVGAPYAPYTPPGCVYTAPPEFDFAMPPCPHYIVAPRPMTKSELLRGALCHLEAAGADELVKLVRVEVVTEEKRELAEELSRKEAELQALKSDVDRLRAKVGEPQDEARPASPQVKVKVQVLELDLAKIEAAGIELPPAAFPNQTAKPANAQYPASGEDKATIRPAKPEDLAAWMNRKAAQPISVQQSGLCVIDSPCELNCFLESLREAKAVKVLAEPCLVAPSGKRARFCCGAGEEAHLHSAIKPCDFCSTSGFDLDLVATVTEADQIRTEVTLRHRTPLVVPANTSGLEGPLPPAIRRTEMHAEFIARSGQTFVSSLRRQATCTDDCAGDETTDGIADEKADAKPKSKEVLCLILVTPCLVAESKCAACSAAPCKCETECKAAAPCKCEENCKCEQKCKCEEKCKCEAECKCETKNKSHADCKCDEKCECNGKCPCSKSESKPTVFKTTTADGVRLRTMREPFLKDVQVDETVELDEIELGGVRPKFVEEYCPECQRKRNEATKSDALQKPANDGKDPLLKAAFHYYRPGDKSTDSTPRHWGPYPPERPFIISGMELRR